VYTRRAFSFTIYTVKNLWAGLAKKMYSQDWNK